MANVVKNNMNKKYLYTAITTFLIGIYALYVWRKERNPKLRKLLAVGIGLLCISLVNFILSFIVPIE